MTEVVTRKWRNGKLIPATAEEYDAVSETVAKLKPEYSGDR